MSVIFLDGMAHYTTRLQAETKVANSQLPYAGAGAFGTPAVYGPTEGIWINFTGLTTLDFACYGLVTAGGSAPPLWQAWNTAGVQLTLSVASDGTVSILRGGYAGTVLGTSAANTLVFGAQHHFYISTVISATVGTFTLKIDGVSVFALTGLNTSNQATANCTQVRPLGAGAAALMALCAFSHIQISDTAGDLAAQYRLGALFPNGAGNYAEWTTLVGAATHWQAVDETTPNDDTDYVATATVGHRDSYAMQDTAANTTAIGALAVTAYLKKDDANARTVAAFLRIGGVDYFGATKAVPAAPYSYLQWIWQVSPATTIAFTKAEVDNLEAGMKVIA